MIHIPVLLKEVIGYLDVKPNRDYIDATLGGGGYTREILKRNAPAGKVLAIDWNEEAIKNFKKELSGKTSEVAAPKKGEPRSDISEREEDSKINISVSGAPLGGALRASREKPEPSSLTGSKFAPERLTLVHGNFANIKDIALLNNFSPAGIVFDLGLSSDLLESSGRGFSFQRDEPLIMTYGHRLPLIFNGLSQTSRSEKPDGKTLGVKEERSDGGTPSVGEEVSGRMIKTAREMVNTYNQEDLERVLREYGEIRQAQKISQGIVTYRKNKRIFTTSDLREAIESVLKSPTPKILAQIWQAIRIEVNDELGNLKNGLEGAWEVLETEGRLAVVSYHSLEDRIVKNFFKNRFSEKPPKLNKKTSEVEERSVKQGATILTKKPITPSKEEIKRNQRARSAKLRCVEKIIQIHK